MDNGLSLEHGDKVLLSVNNTPYDGHIECRMLGQWPDKREGLFVVVDNLPTPRFPIPVNEFQDYYGTIKKRSK